MELYDYLLIVNLINRCSLPTNDASRELKFSNITFDRRYSMSNSIVVNFD